MPTDTLLKLEAACKTRDDVAVLFTYCEGHAGQAWTQGIPEAPTYKPRGFAAYVWAVRYMLAKQLLPGQVAAGSSWLAGAVLVIQSEGWGHPVPQPVLDHSSTYPE